MTSPLRTGAVSPPSAAKREWYATREGTPFVIEQIPFEMRCKIPVLPGGDGAETVPLELRTARCNHPTFTLWGSGPTCGHHLVMMFRLAGIAPRGPVPECAA